MLFTSTISGNSSNLESIAQDKFLHDAKSIPKISKFKKHVFETLEGEDKWDHARSLRTLASDSFRTELKPVVEAWDTLVREK